MDNRGFLMLAFLFCVYILKVYAVIELVCKGESLDEDYKFLEHLNMGYKNPKTLDLIKKNTLCGIQTICRSILQMTAPTPECLFGDARILEATVQSFSKLSQDALVIIYNMNAGLDSQVLYPLWLFSIYVEHIHFRWLESDLKVIAKVHKMIIEQLTNSMEGCPEHNEFDVTDTSSHFYFESSGQPDYSGNFTLFLNQIREHFDQIRPKLIEVTGENYKRINARNLLIDSTWFLVARFNYNQIKHFFGISIEWTDAIHKLLEAFWEANNPSNLFNGLQGIRNYRLLNLTMMKMVMLRLLWIHFLTITDEISNRQEINNKLYLTTNHFGNLTGLNDDDEAFYKTVQFLRDECSLAEVSKAAIDHIKKQLKNSCSLFEDSSIVKEDAQPLTAVESNVNLAIWFVEEVEEVLKYVDPAFVNSVLALAYVIPENSDHKNTET